MRNEWRREVASAQAQGILNLSQQGFGPKPGITNVGRESGKEGGEGTPQLGIHGSNGCCFLQRVKVKRDLSHHLE